MERSVLVLGSTGSVGSNTLDILRNHKNSFQVVALACGHSIEKFLEQILEFSPSMVSVGDAETARRLKSVLPRSHAKLPIFEGPEGHRQMVEETRPDVLISAMTGTHGLLATLQAVQQNTMSVGIANKEILVMAGTFFQAACRTSLSKLVPVDSEHSAIFQALMGNRREHLKKIVLTASGGPFRTWKTSDFLKISKADALKHPNWSMGAKITIDSATMMNKGLEFIEAIRLFEVDASQIEIVIHPESIVHSLVEYCDGSMMAQLGFSDMRMPISLALSYPERTSLAYLQKSLSLTALGSLHFESPDFEKFPCLRLALRSYELGVAGPVILNAANEIAVSRFLDDQLGFTEIPELVERALEEFEGTALDTLEDVISFDERVKDWAFEWRIPKVYASTKN